MSSSRSESCHSSFVITGNGMGLTGPAPPVYLTGMKVLILTFGSRGDVQPYVALGAALRKRGHAVTLATGQGFEAMVEGQGLTPAPLSVDVRALVESPEMKRADRKSVV